MDSAPRKSMVSLRGLQRPKTRNSGLLSCQLKLTTTDHPGLDEKLIRPSQGPVTLCVGTNPEAGLYICLRVTNLVVPYMQFTQTTTGRLGHVRGREGLGIIFSWRSQLEVNSWRSHERNKPSRHHMNESKARQIPAQTCIMIIRWMCCLGCRILD